MEKTRKVQILLVFLVIVAIIYLVVLPYYNRYLLEEVYMCDMKSEYCTFDLNKSWSKSSCTNNINDALVYRVDIINYDNGSISQFNCQLGKSYQYVSNSSNFRTLNCNSETVELINLVVKGLNKTPVHYALLSYAYPKNLTDVYTYNILYCNKSAGGYSIYFYMNRSGLFYP